MKQETIDRLGPLAAARKSSLMTQQDMADVLGVSVPTLLNYEKEPESAALGDIAKIYRAVGADGREVIKSYLADLFTM